MSVLDHLDPSFSPDEHIPKYKSTCCVKFSVDTQCKRCPFLQIKDEDERKKAQDSCRDKRYGSYTWHDENEQVDVIIEYNNKYI